VATEKQETNWDVLVDKTKTTVSENKVLFSIGTVSILILAVVLYGMIGGDNNAPDFTLKDTDGTSFSLSDYEGEQVVILDFMFSTCEPCEKFVKEALGPYSEKMDNDDVAILSVSVFGNDDEAELRDYAENHGWRHALGDSEGDIEIAYDVIGTPKIFIIDKNGEITYPPPKIKVSVTTKKQEKELNEPGKVKEKRFSILPGLIAISSIFLVGAFAPESFMNHFIVFVLSCFIGYMVIWNVTASLHTPLMSVTNAVSSIIIIGALSQISSSNLFSLILSGFAVFIASINIVGGFAVTKRMLGMFKK